MAGAEAGLSLHLIDDRLVLGLRDLVQTELAALAVRVVLVADAAAAAPDHVRGHVAGT